MKKKVVVIGSGITGAMASAYIKKRQPELEVTVISPNEKKLPIVGESLTEFSTQLFHELGLSPYLEEEHYHKYGLTFYFKENIESPECDRYSAHEAHTIPPMPSNQLNRFTFDKKIREVGRELGVKYVEARVKSVDIGKAGNSHTVVYRSPSGENHSKDADWIIDASGRRQVLSTLLEQKRDAPYQRSAYWFRLVNFDAQKLTSFQQIKPPQCCFDSYFVTHHFFGKGNWIWAIPMRTREYQNMISVGIVWRPDLQDLMVKDVDGFKRVVKSEHPHLVDFIESGEVLDSSLYSNYLYESEQVYSDDGWFLVGDAADAVDPLYSTGLVMSSLQITQIEEMILRDSRGELERQFVEDMGVAYKTVRNSLQLEISTLYDVMHDPYQSHWRMHFVSLLYFFFLLPAWLAGYMKDRAGARLITSLIQAQGAKYPSLLELLEIGSKRLGPIPSEKLTNKYYKTVNWDLWGPCDRMIPKYLSRLLYLQAAFRFELLRNAGWHQWPMHLRICAIYLLQSVFVRVFFWRRSLRRSYLVKKWLGVNDKSQKDDNAFSSQQEKEPAWRPGYST